MEQIIILFLLTVIFSFLITYIYRIIKSRNKQKETINQQEKLINLQKNRLKQQDVVLNQFTTLIQQLQQLNMGHIKRGYYKKPNFNNMSKYDLDDILMEINEKGLENLDKYKINFLKNYNKNK